MGLLYTSLYFMNLLPTNQTGENPGWNSAEPYYSDIFTLWDLFRCSTALLHVIQPATYEGDSMDIYQTRDLLIIMVEPKVVQMPIMCLPMPT